MDLDLGGARVIITAGAAGIGREIAKGFLEEGAAVSVCDVDADALDDLAAKHPGIHGAVCDVTDCAGLGRFVHDAAARMGGIDAVINNAGTAGPTAGIEDIDPSDWARCIDVCLTSQFNTTRLALPYLRQSTNASITNMSSAAGEMGFARRTPYAAAKWGVIGLTKSLSIELGADGIRANAILPGIVAGDRQRRVMEARAQSHGQSFAEIEAAAFSHASIKDYVTPRQLADQILFLASPRGRMISRQAISVCGDLKILG